MCALRCRLTISDCVSQRTVRTGQRFHHHPSTTLLSGSSCGVLSSLVVMSCPSTALSRALTSVTTKQTATTAGVRVAAFTCARGCCPLFSHEDPLDCFGVADSTQLSLSTKMCWGYQRSHQVTTQRPCAHRPAPIHFIDLI